ncbi:MAG: ABC transporter ATP-binding protein/permease [archaeon GB-1867-097]|nr:ABC transporter ATP-binding protein/permease [Candidatus Culexmicrobium thermophilum]MCS7384218.1 ABC transporter ATP-binding protein/permease [Candidatus Culexmicrobium thermophilum]HDO20476.1 ABC transporter ATP-binding protein [Candidatus Bathyarchaeota archaeon]
MKRIGDERTKMETQSKGESSLQTFKHLIPYIMRKWKYFLLSVIFMFIGSQFSVLTPNFTRMVIDAGIIKGSFETVTFYSLLIFLVSCLNSITSYFQRYLSVLFSQSVVLDLRNVVFSAIQRQSFAFFDKMPIGQLVARVTNDTDRLTRFLAYQLARILQTVFLIILAFINMYSMSPKLTLIAAIFIPIIMLLNIKYSRIIFPLYSKIRYQVGVLTSVADNSLTGFRTVKALNIENYQIEKFKRENETFLKLSLKAAKLRVTYGQSGFLVLAFAMSAILYFGGVAIINGEFTVGSLAAFNSYFLMLMWPVRSIGFFIASFQRSMTSARRLFEIINRVPEVEEKPNAVELPPIKGEVVFKNVSFGYIPGKFVLKNINLTVKPGEKIAILGPTGSGKSTLIRLIPRFYDVTEGKILIDGYDIRDVKLKSLRRQIAIVSQEPFIFAGSFKDNIKLANPKASMSDIIKAAKIAKIHDFIVSLPKGYDTVIGERGITLSGGQKQRLTIARALVADAKILILDDPTSNLDAETERELVEDLKKLMKGRTTFIVTQRLPLILLADKIIVLDKGVIKEIGTHEELVKKRGLYYSIYVELYKKQKAILTGKEAVKVEAIGEEVNSNGISL